MSTTKRPNPAVALAERAAASTEAMAGMAGTSGVKSDLDALAKRKRATAQRIKARNPNLISSE